MQSFDLLFHIEAEQTGEQAVGLSMNWDAMPLVWRLREVMTRDITYVFLYQIP